jgi:hypothetical protein
MTRRWTIAWSGDRFTDPAGSLRAPIRGIADQLTVHELVDRWSPELSRHFPLIDESESWWYLRFELHRILATYLPQARALRKIATELAAPPEHIVLRHPPDPWWRELLAGFFSAANVTVQSEHDDPCAEQIASGALFYLRGATSLARYQRWMSRPRRKPRVLLLAREYKWNGAVDTELGPVQDALEAHGLEPVVMATQSGRSPELLRGLRTRPHDHLFSEQLRLQRKATARRTISPRFVAPTRSFQVENIDLTRFARAVLRRTAESSWRKQIAYLEQLPDLTRQLGIAAVVMTDENNTAHPFKLALRRAGVPLVAVQHGVIHEDHLSYVFPESAAPERVVLCDKTCVYGDFYADILTRRSIYAANQVVATGQVQMDRREVVDREYGARTPRGERLRRSALSPGTDRLLFFTSQTYFRSATGPALLRLLAQSSSRNHLVIRPHPLEQARPFWSDLIAASDLEARVTLAPPGTLDEWLDACDVHISTTSTVLAEAVAFGRPNLVLDADGQGDWMETVEEGVAHSVSDFPSLDAAVDHCLSPDRHAAMERNRLRFVDRQFHKLDGRAGERIADEVRRSLDEIHGS